MDTEETKPANASIITQFQITFKNPNFPREENVPCTEVKVLQSNVTWIT